VRITSYVSFGTTQKTSKRTSKVYELFMLADLTKTRIPFEMKLDKGFSFSNRIKRHKGHRASVELYDLTQKMYLFDKATGRIITL